MASLLRFDEFTLDEDRRQVFRGSEPVSLESKVFAVELRPGDTIEIGPEAIVLLGPGGEAGTTAGDGR